MNRTILLPALTWHEYEIEFTADSPLKALRIDPSSAPGEIEIDRVSLHKDGESPLWEWKSGPQRR